jgi:deoxycytidine triphosphate deaminase
MVLSDRTIARLLAEGRIEIDPYDDSLLQPSSVDVRVDRYFRVFHNNRYPFIDVREEQEDLTELVEVEDETAFVLHPGEFVLGSTLERVRLPDDLVARLEGKALALDTLVPTTQGWKTMGELRVGDLVFDEDGFPVAVLGATPPMTRRPCFEIRFSDGTTVVTDVDHQWRTIAKRDREHRQRMDRIVTTGHIRETLRVRGEVNHHIPVAGASWYPERELPIDPYVLGVWIGDGTTAKAEITSADDEILAEVAAAGYRVARQRTRPPVYRIGGTGHTRCAATGRLKRDQMCELVASPGFSPTLGRKRAKLDGRDIGPRYEIQFVPNRPVFRLSRKLARQKVRGRFHEFRGIVDVRETPSVPVRCIEVSSASGLFLVTKAFIPTHNSSLGRLGLLIHSTAGFIDPGWNGHVTLELSNVANLPVTIYPGMKIGQISFVQLTEPAETPYGTGEIGSKYQGQRGPTPSRYWQNFQREPSE